MLRFRSAAPPAKAGLTKRNRWRLWMLVIALGLVLALMRQLGQPETARRLEQWFGRREPSSGQPVLDFDQIGSGKSEAGFRAEQEKPKPSPSTPDEADDLLSQVKDRTYFRPEEQEAWFSLFAKLQQMDDARLSSQSVGERTYAQLLQQPDVYRGRLVTIRGTARRVELQHPAANAPGIDSYYRLWIQPRGGGQWPFVVYCLELPAGFPSGEPVRASVSVTGFFFKNWSYAYEGGLGLAPVVLASKLDWEKPVARPAVQPITCRNWTIGIAVASAVALFVTWQAIRHTRRRPSKGESDDAIRRRLQQWENEEGDA